MVEAGGGHLTTKGLVVEPNLSVEFAEAVWEGKLQVVTWKGVWMVIVSMESVGSKGGTLDGVTVLLVMFRLQVVIQGSDCIDQFAGGP